jgi:hypothetical protein
MGLKIGILAFPLMIIAMILKQKGPAAKIMKLGAISPATARKPADLDLRDRYILPDAVKRGVIVKLDDGRYYVDLPTFRRRRRWSIALAVVICAGLVVTAWLIWPRPA